MTDNDWCYCRDGRICHYHRTGTTPLAEAHAEIEQLTHRAEYAERVWKELGASREQLQAEVESLKPLLRNNQVRREEVEMRHGDLLRYVDQLKAALARVVAAYNAGLPSWQMADIAEKALGPTKE